ncbi:hypothetical protein [Methylotenera sp.]|uniref:hypothetical protein n=1 Tax=Methylotenera sp. TaxID=2051956 RepID=UPI002730D049|nr:hypothetical protein [Methylotenera sp.]MDP2071996.1 hypothetical protein [Methylotenera sp.]MDP3006995.1 hypothetical protein [Methylotenera sp.]MDP3007068.1 hypothetical protein [Methylotenera sp.]
MEIKQSPESFDQFMLKPRGDKLIRINISRNVLFAIVFSLLVHGLILFLVLPQIQFDNAAALPPTAMEVSLAPPKPPEVILPVEKPIEEPVKQPEKKPNKPSVKTKVITQKSSQDSKPPAFSVPNVIATPQPAPEIISPKESIQDIPTDMASYVKQQQAKRLASETSAAKQNAEAVAREIGPSAEQVRDERIKNNFKNGTNGIFEITSLGGRHAAFSFRGWTNDYSNSRRESFEVEASTGQDVRLVMIKKMISLIRKHYQGDFNWESQRLGRVIVQSARPEDNAGLEEFMMMEFFGTNYKNSS